MSDRTFSYPRWVPAPKSAQAKLSDFPTFTDKLGRVTVLVQSLAEEVRLHGGTIEHD